MCTCVTLNFERFYFGRNMDLEGSFGECVVTAPRNFALPFKTRPKMERHYAMIGMAKVVSDYPLFADAMNEKGLCMAGLNFPGNAIYREEHTQQKAAITPFELIPWVLGQCATAKEAMQLMRETDIVAIHFSDTLPLTPLHWLVSDRETCFVIEPTEEGVCLYDDPVGILTNNPSFPYHMANIAQYTNLNNVERSDNLLKNVGASSFGLGGIGLPGDYSSASRFVRAAFLRQHLTEERGGEAQVDSVFHILGAVAPPKGSVLSLDGKPHYTTYSCCMDAAEGRYYCKRNGRLDISCFALDDVEKNDILFHKIFHKK